MSTWTDSKDYIILASGINWAQLQSSLVSLMYEFLSSVIDILNKIGDEVQGAKNNWVFIVFYPKFYCSNVSSEC